MPMSKDFENRLYPMLPEIIEEFGTPFHIYDEKGIKETSSNLIGHMPFRFQEFFAVKALPDPAILRIMNDMGFGFDCSSEVELILARAAGASQEKIMFTSNNTMQHEFETALLKGGGCILNLDDVNFLWKPYMQNMFPELICFRINPGDKQTGSIIIGNPQEAKYGIMWEQIVPAYRMAREMGATRFGLHTMVASNDLDFEHMLVTIDLLLEAAALLESELGIEVEFINAGGGIGIPYKPDGDPFDLESFGEGCRVRLDQFVKTHGFKPQLFMENGRCITGPHGVLVTRAINRKDTYQKHVGVEVAMPALMRPAMYDAYHHITTLPWGGKRAIGNNETVNIVGPICENCDRLATQRSLPQIYTNEEDGDLIVVHDTGAHGAAMGFNYNGRTRPKGLLLLSDGNVVLTRREETVQDLLRATRGL